MCKTNFIFFKNIFGSKKFTSIFALPKHKKGKDFVAQLVEHITFNDGVLGSSPSEITKKRSYKFVTSFLF
jgi:hypothetical protein